MAFDMSIIDAVRRAAPEYDKKYTEPLPSRFLGGGTFGKVFLVNRKSDNHEFAAKFIQFHGTPKERLYHQNEVRNEIRALEILSKDPHCHPNVVCITESFETNGNIGMIIVTEYIDGADLDRYQIKSRGQVYEFFYQFALGLKHLKDLNTIHRDLKPANTRVSADGRTLKLIDLGLSCTALYHPGREPGCKDLAGTYSFLDPIVFGTYYSTFKSDVYSMGATFYTLIRQMRDQNPNYYIRPPPSGRRGLQGSFYPIYNNIENDLRNGYPDYDIRFLELLRRMLHPYDVIERPTIEEVLRIGLRLPGVFPRPAPGAPPSQNDPPTPPRPNVNPPPRRAPTPPRPNVNPPPPTPRRAPTPPRPNVNPPPPTPRRAPTPSRNMTGVVVEPTLKEKAETPYFIRENRKWDEEHRQKGMRTWARQKKLDDVAKKKKLEHQRKEEERQRKEDERQREELKKDEAARQLREQRYQKRLDKERQKVAERQQQEAERQRKEIERQRQEIERQNEEGARQLREQRQQKRMAKVMQPPREGHLLTRYNRRHMASIPSADLQPNEI